jgi:predicted tellurium resistance membrane protein TerC
LQPPKNNEDVENSDSLRWPFQFFEVYIRLSLVFWSGADDCSADTTVTLATIWFNASFFGDPTMLELLSDPQIWLAFLTLTALELVLGIDNVIFISILVDKLPPHQRETARRIGLFAAMFMRIGLLLVLAWIVGLKETLFTVFGQAFSGRDIVLLLGGLFLIWKSVGEIHESIEGAHQVQKNIVHASFGSIIIQIMLVDMVFSLDSIITAVGMVDHIGVMVAAVLVSVALMMLFAGPIGRFVSAHPTVKMLALAFLVAIGVVLIAESFGTHVPKGYIYTAMLFSVLVEMLNLRMRKRSSRPVDIISSMAEVEDIEKNKGQQ